MIAPSSQADAAVLDGIDPVEVVRVWPASEPLAVMRSGARWTILARPSATQIGRAGVWAPPRAGGAAGPLSAGLSRGCPSPGWLGFIAYEAGGVFEPTTGPAPEVLSVWRRCDGFWVHDRDTGAWTAHGDAPSLSTPGSARDARAGRLEEVDGEARYVESVARVIEAIRAGDVYQANVAHRLRTGFDGSARRLFSAMLAASDAWHGAYLEWDDGGVRRAICSASPELFVRLDGDGFVVTRPMKGTAPAAAGVLAASSKDRAELNMIVDLMRNDFGRVCRWGSVRVAEARAIETHGALHQGVATVVGRLREGLGFEALMRATFPGGSITGAPKIRAMQIIRELEGFDRGAFCGAIGHVGDDGSAQLSIGIRTATIEGGEGRRGLDDVCDGVLTHPVGAGIVVDSSPEAEWRETMDKSQVLREALDRLER